jgi:putative hydrolase
VSDEPIRPDDDSDANDPFGAMFAGMGLGGGGGVADLGAMLSRLGAMLQSSDDSPVPWDVVDQSVNDVLAGQPDAPIDARERARLDDAARLADIWLDEATTFASSGASVQAWTRREWITSTSPAWRALVEPLASRAGEAFGPGQMTSIPGAPPEMAAMMNGPLGQMVQRMGAVVFAGQVGQGLAQLSGTVLTTADIALPLTDDAQAAVVVANVAEFSEGLGVSDEDVALYLCLRALAHARLVAHAPWLAGRFVAAVDEYARGIKVDTAALEEQLRGIDPTDPSALNEAVESGMFAPADTPEQVAAQARIETLIALVDGWVDDVVTQAVSRMPSAVALRETLQRRRAAGGPAEQTFSALVGLELRPRRLREASALWTRIREERGMAERDALWAHPDLLPVSEDLDSPETFGTTPTFDISELDDLAPFDDTDKPDTADPTHGDPSAP